MKVDYFIAHLTLLVVLASILAFEEVQCGTEKYLAKLRPEASSKEIKNNIKVLLTKMKLRHVPLAKKRSERLLAQLYKEERELREEIEELEKNLSRISSNANRCNLRIAQVKVNADRNSGKSKDGGFQEQINKITADRVEQWTRSLTENKLHYVEIRAKISEAQKVAKDPENYVSVPMNYGLNPKEHRERETAALIRDRKNILFRNTIVSGGPAPLWITDNW